VTCYIRGRYLYEVAGTRYVGNRFTFDDRDVGGPELSIASSGASGPATALMCTSTRRILVRGIDITSQFRLGRALLGAAAVAVACSRPRSG